MTTIHNEILINASKDVIWGALCTVDVLEQYDPTVMSSKVLSDNNSGLGSSRKVEMIDGKNWFKEKCTVFKTNEQLTFELTECSFPVNTLKHTYQFEQIGTHIKVKQIMTYKMKFGILGNIIDMLMVRNKSDKGIKLFMNGLKTYSEKYQ